MNETYAGQSTLSKLMVGLGFAALAPIGVWVLAMGVGAILNLPPFILQYLVK